MVFSIQPKNCHGPQQRAIHATRPLLSKEMLYARLDGPLLRTMTTKVEQAEKKL
jgi:hypothetical protein